MTSLCEPDLAGHPWQMDFVEYFGRSSATAARQNSAFEGNCRRGENRFHAPKGWRTASRRSSLRGDGHKLMDPIGFSMENYDAIGRWRTHESGTQIDATGGLPDGSKFEGVAGLQKALLARPENFVDTMTEKLMTYALGRGVEFYDEPAIRKVVNDSHDQDYRFSSLVLGIVNSTPFQMRRAQ